MENFNVSGIYCIKNKINNYKYIGSSNNILRRLKEHRSRILNNSHCNDYLSRSVLKYEFKNFEVDILAKCPLNYLINLEQWFINNLNPEYNISLSANIPAFSKESINKRSIKLMKKFYQYDLNGNFIAEHKGFKITGNKMGIHYQGIIQCCNKKILKSGGYQWRYEKYNKIKSLKFKSLGKKVLVTKDSKINFINGKAVITPEYKNTFDSIGEACKKLNLNKGNACGVARGNIRAKSVGGYNFKYID